MDLQQMKIWIAPEEANILKQRKFKALVKAINEQGILVYIIIGAPLVNNAQWQKKIRLIIKFHINIKWQYYCIYQAAAAYSTAQVSQAQAPERITTYVRGKSLRNDAPTLIERLVSQHLQSQTPVISCRCPR